MRTTAMRMMILCCALYLSGLHWFALQTAAWTGMLTARASNIGLVEAARTTFDGEHPCALCRAVEKGRADEQEEQKNMPAPEAFAKIQFLIPACVQIPPRPALQLDYEQPMAAYGDARLVAPLVPPPRTA